MTSRDLMPFGKYKGQPLSAIPQSYSDWLCKQDGFSEKNPDLFAYFTKGEIAASTPKEREIINTEQQLLNSVSAPFKAWWFRSYGERLRKQGEAHYIAYLRVAIGAWSAASKQLAEDVLQRDVSDAVATVNDDTPDADADLDEHGNPYF